MRRTHIITSLILASLYFASAQAQEGVSNIMDIMKRVATYDSRCTQEKVYLHLDNNAYFIDETVYFKAYVVRASSLKNTDLSKVLYVELLDDHGNVCERKNYEITDGQASGSITLANLIHGGYYEIRAFTRAMLNWDSEYCFSRVVPVYQKKEDSNALMPPYIYQETGEDHLPWLRKEPNTLRSDSVRKNGVLVEFYPEGGALLKKDCKQKIAYRITDKKGNPISYAECKVSQNGNTVTVSKPQHEGMGEFLISSGKEGTEFNVNLEGKDYSFALPAARESGIAAMLQQEGDSIGFNLDYTPDLEGKYLGISITCRGAACVFDTIRLGGKPRWQVAKKNLHYGINQITLFNSEGNILWERLVWRAPDYPVSLEIKQNEEVYKPFAPIVLDMTLADKSGNPCNAYFSLAVHDRDSELKGNDCGIAEDLLLSSDIKGYVAYPEEYFESDDDTHRKWLDLLLLVQGWRRYDFNEMTEKKPFTLAEPAETGQLLKGYLLANKGKRLPMANAELKVDIRFPGMAAKGECKTDSTGGFAFMMPSYYGEGIGRFYTYDENGKAKTMRIFLERDFAPTPRMFDVQEFNLSAYKHNNAPNQVPTFTWNDTIAKGDILLGEAVVKGKRIDKRDGQDKWNGGEGFAKRNADICYNIDIESMKYCDKGEDDPLLWDLLKVINKNFDYTTDDAPIAGTSYKFTYRNRPVVIFRHNTEQSTDEHMDNLTVFASEINRLYIITDQEKVKRVLPEYGSDDGMVTAILLYGDGNQLMMKEKSKTKVVRFFGYSSDPDFAVPDYRKRDLPDSSDQRRTLYWNPDVLTDENGKATVIFYSNANKDVRLGITARAVLPDGELLNYER
jgi:hypothetical protein